MTHLALFRTSDVACSASIGQLFRSGLGSLAGLSSLLVCSSVETRVSIGDGDRSINHLRDKQEEVRS